LSALQNDALLRALARQPTEHTPIWLMRQAGRYLPEYTATRARAGSFLALAKSPAFRETPESRRYLADLAIRARVRAALRSDERTAEIVIDVEVTAGAVTLRGIVVDDREKRLCQEVVGAVPGVASVRDELRTMTAGLQTFPQQPREV